MKANRIRICGRNTSTLPTPAITPSTSRLRNGPSAMCVRTSVAAPSTTDLIASIGHCAQLNTAWNISSSSAASSSMPHSGCSSTRSMASSRASGCGGACTQAATRRCTSRCVSITSSMPGGAPAARGVRPISGRRKRSSAATSAPAPSPRTPTVGSTGTPSSAASRSASTRIPRRPAMSVMFSASSIGRPRRLASSTRRRFSRSLVASTTHTSRSGTGSPARRPVTMSRVISSSRLSALRL